jgi:hypothetical protein
LVSHWFDQCDSKRFDLIWLASALLGRSRSRILSKWLEEATRRG